MAIETVILIAAATASAAGGISQGIAASKAAKAEQEQFNRQAQLAEIKALETENIRRQELNETLGNIRAIGAASGLDPTSATLTTFEREAIDRSHANLTTERYNLQQDVFNKRAQARAAGSRARSSLFSGVVSGVGSGLSIGAGGFRSPPGGG